MRILLDEMLSPEIAKNLRAAGADVLAVSEEPHLRGTPDADLLALAAGEGRLLVTDNVQDFAPLDRLWAAQGRSHAGVLFVSSKAFPQDRARKGRITAALRLRLDAGTWPPSGQVGFL